MRTRKWLIVTVLGAAMTVTVMSARWFEAAGSAPAEQALQFSLSGALSGANFDGGRASWTAKLSLTRDGAISGTGTVPENPQLGELAISGTVKDGIISVDVKKGLLPVASFSGRQMGARINGQYKTVMGHAGEWNSSLGSFQADDAAPKS